MATNQSTIEYALYYDDKVVALVCDNNLYVKITDQGKSLAGDNYEEGRPFPGAKPYILISGDLWEDKLFLEKLITVTAKNLPPPKIKKAA